MKTTIIALILLACGPAAAEETNWQRYERAHAAVEQHQQRAHRRRVERELRKQTRLMEEQARRERRAAKKTGNPSERSK